jgi:hypothetical protein
MQEACMSDFIPDGHIKLGEAVKRVGAAELRQKLFAGAVRSFVLSKHSGLVPVEARWWGHEAHWNAALATGEGKQIRVVPPAARQMNPLVGVSVTYQGPLLLLCADVDRDRDGSVHYLTPAAALEGNGPGRPRKYDREAALAECVRLANMPDGLPEEADLKKHLVDWFAQRDEYPGKTTIDEIVRKIRDAR